jgi:hypothetical protein
MSSLNLQVQNVKGTEPHCFESVQQYVGQISHDKNTRNTLILQSTVDIDYVLHAHFALWDLKGQSNKNWQRSKVESIDSYSLKNIVLNILLIIFYTPCFKCVKPFSVIVLFWKQSCVGGPRLCPLVPKYWVIYTYTYICMHIHAYICRYVCMYTYAAVSNGKWKTEVQAISLHPFTICSSCKRKLSVCKRTKRSCLSMVKNKPHYYLI